MRSTSKENLMEHAAQVAIVGEALAIIKNSLYGGSVDVHKVASLALYHDTAEVVSGDLPTPVKYYNPKIKAAYGEIEQVIIDKLLASLPEFAQDNYADMLRPNENSDEYKIMKVADKLSAFIKCVEEKMSGNKEFDTAYKRIKEQLDEMRPEHPELAYFMDNFAASFGKQVDIL